MTEHPTTTPRVVLGVLGGLGPVASAEFVRTVYAHCAGEREQDFPAVVLRSDPSFDARSPAAMDDEDATLPDRLADGVRALLTQGCTHVVVACMTLHHLLPRLPAELRRRVVSVVDVLVAGVAAAGPGPHLLLCSRVARAVGLFERHPRWPEVASSVVLPSVARNDDLHAAIMDIKVNRGHGAARRWLAAELARYGTASAVAGCSEIHVLAKEWQGPPGHQPLSWIDPFDAIARATAAQDLTTLARQAATAAATGARPAGSAAR
ncbi:MAG TPA: aspartate/glutamate racemase family protein [Streptosporangiaceae bacterium]